jgi:hypothetical protein
VSEHTETFEKTAKETERINRRIEEIKAVQDPPGTAIKACEAAMTMLEPLYARLNAVELVSAALQTATSMHLEAKISASELSDLRLDVDKLKSRSDVGTVAPINVRNRIVALEESRGTAAAARIKERLSELEKNLNEINDAQSALANS